MADSAEAASTVATPEGKKEQGRGHIGLVVLASIAAGLILGLVLVLVRIRPRGQRVSSRVRL